MDTLAGRRALVTGGASGIGRACARLLAEAGAAVAVADIDPEAAETVASSIRSEGGHAISIACDVSRDADCSLAVAAAMRDLGGLDILVTRPDHPAADGVETTRPSGIA